MRRNPDASGTLEGQEQLVRIRAGGLAEPEARGSWPTLLVLLLMLGLLLGLGLGTLVVH